MDFISMWDWVQLAFWVGFAWAAGHGAFKQFDSAIDKFLEGVGTRFRAVRRKQSQPITEYPAKLRAAPWGDGNQPQGTVNIFCDEWQTTVAEDVPTVIAQELVRRWNRGPK